MMDDSKQLPVHKVAELMGPFPTPEDFYQAVCGYVDGWYQGHPRHAEMPWQLVIAFEGGSLAFVYSIYAPTKQHMFAMHQGSLGFPGRFPVAYSGLICEAWTRRMQPDEEQLFDSLADDPKSIESVLINILTQDRQAIMAGPIDRSGQFGATVEHMPFSWRGAEGGEWSGSAVRKEGKS